MLPQSMPADLKGMDDRFNNVKNTIDSEYDFENFLQYMMVEYHTYGHIIVGNGCREDNSEKKYSNMMISEQGGR